MRDDIRDNVRDSIGDDMRDKLIISDIILIERAVTSFLVELREVPWA